MENNLIRYSIIAMPFLFLKKTWNIKLKVNTENKFIILIKKNEEKSYLTRKMN